MEDSRELDERLCLVDVIEGAVRLLSPSVGRFEPVLAQGTPFSQGVALGSIVVSGRSYRLSVSSVDLLAHLGASGLTESEVLGAAHYGSDIVPGAVPGARDVQCGDVLFQITAHQTTAAKPKGRGVDTGASLAALETVFLAPLGGRFFWRPKPEAPPFVSPGDVINSGTRIGLVEVMKTYHPVLFVAPAAAEAVVVEALLVSDGADVDEGQPLFRWRPEHVVL